MTKGKGKNQYTKDEIWALLQDARSEIKRLEKAVDETRKGQALLLWLDDDHLEVEGWRTGIEALLDGHLTVFDWAGWSRDGVTRTEFDEMVGQLTQGDLEWSEER